MATRLYLRNLTADNPPTAGEKSAALPSDTLGANNATGTDETRSLRTTKGSVQTSISKNSDATTAARDNYLCRFTSPALAAQTIAAATWTIAIALSEGNNNANSFLILSLYVWRPSTQAVVGYIYDSHTSLGVEWGATEDGQVITFSGAAITVQAGDVLVLEVWRHAVQGMAAAYAQTVYFDGTTDVTDATTSDAASYLEYPGTLSFAGQTVVVGQAVETDLSQPVSRLKASAVAQVLESDLAQAVGPLKRSAVAQALETDLAQPIAWAPKHRLISLATETDLAQALTRRKAQAVAQALETDLSQTVGRLKQKTVEQSTETDTAHPLVAPKIISVLQALETDLSQAVGRLKAKVLGQASETDLAQPVTRNPIARLIGMAVETDIAQAISVAGGQAYQWVRSRSSYISHIVGRRRR